MKTYKTLVMIAMAISLLVIAFTASAGYSVLWPVINGANKVSQGWSSYHKAIDVLSSGNDTIHAVEAATVMYSGWHSNACYNTQTGATTSNETAWLAIPQSHRSAACGGYYVKLRHNNGSGGNFFTWYFHLKEGTLYQGSTVTRGQPIAQMGQSGTAYGKHLHFVVAEVDSLSSGLNPLDSNCAICLNGQPGQPPPPPSPPPVPNITQVGRYIPTTYNPPNNGTPRFEITLKNNSPYEAHLKEVFLRLRHTNGTTVQVPFWSRSSNMLIIPPGGTWVFRTHSPPLPGRGLWEVHKVEMLHASDTWLQGIPQNGWLMVHEANYALNRPVFVHTVREGSGNTPQRVNDGSPLTRWESEWYDDQMIEIDLGQTRTIDTVMLHWESAYAKVFRVKVGSNCGSSPHQCTWTQVYSTSNGKGGDSAITFNEINGRWVKIELVQRGTPWGFSLWEFGVYNRYTG